jgi:hypothetical protein
MRHSVLVRFRNQRRTPAVEGRVQVVRKVLLGVVVLTGCSGVPSSSSRAPSSGGDTSTVTSAPEVSLSVKGEDATWRVDASAPPSPEATRVRALVTRLACHSGVTGQVLPPSVVSDATTITITFEVAADNAASGTFWNCQGNNAVPYDVDFGQTLGDRKLVDGNCLDGRQARTTAFCTEDPPVRWPPSR